MRQIWAILLLGFSACQPSREDLMAEAERAQAEVLRQAEIKQSVQAFGGTVIGKDEGEWGGEVAFREADGTTYSLVADNSHGIFNMPFGVVALTGLAHLQANRGAVHLITREPGKRVTATTTLRLPGSPCDVARINNDIVMRIFTGYTSAPEGPSKPIYGCYSLRSLTHLIQTQCPSTVSAVCFG